MGFTIFESTIEHQYYAITCYENLCDDDDAILDFTKQFDPQELEQLSKDKNIPKCGLGKWEFDDSEDMVNVSQRLKSMEFVPGIYCSIFLEKEKRADGSINLKFTFEPIHPKPKHCDEGFFKNEAFTYTCYYTPNGRDSAKQKCNLSKFFAKTTDGTETAIEPDEDDKEVIKNKVYEYYEDCEQLHVGLIGVPTRKCRPSGMGCFHSQLAGAKKDDPAAGCIGFAQKQIASKTEYYDNIGEALICITEESHDQCQYVNRDGSYYLLCCCHTYEINNHVRTCIVDSATIFHEDEHLLPRVRRYLP
uniref:Thyroglobulin type-1 domain-containing protein n=1 Tax=Panagrellus redivivus TaxID=6233 RepID=A0A7E4ZQV5_PANRE